MRNGTMLDTAAMNYDSDKIILKQSKTHRVHRSNMIFKPFISWDPRYQKHIVQDNSLVTSSCTQTFRNLERRDGTRLPL